jgi:hypothetical protein
MASNVTQDVQEQILTTIRKSQEIALDALKTWVETVQSVTQSLPSIPSVSMPLADRLPSPHEVVARGYDFAEQILTNQRKFADEVLEVASPLLPGEENGKVTSKSAAAK